MGCCTSVPIPADEPPRCATCGVSGTIPWGQLSGVQKNSFWIEKNGSLQCKRCAREERMEKRTEHHDQLKYEKKQETIKQVKEKLYPRTENKTNLKKINSGEGWEGTQSFYELWRPASSLAHLFRMSGRAVQRKGTGVPHNMSADAAGNGAPSTPEHDGHDSHPHHHHHRVQLAAQHLDEIQEELMVEVEEESIDGGSNSSFTHS